LGTFVAKFGSYAAKLPDFTARFRGFGLYRGTLLGWKPVLPLFGTVAGVLNNLAGGTGKEFSACKSFAAGLI
jgi:hypothetical protein